MRALAPLVVAVLASACAQPSARDVGEQLFGDPRFSLSETNPFSCATCHAVDPEDTRMLSGGSLVGVAARPSFWGGFETTALDATNVCLTRFMRGGLLAPEEPRARALYEYLASLGTDVGAEAVQFTVVENTGNLDRGDTTRGEEVWQRACADCHGAPHTAEGQIHPSAVAVPEASAAFAVSVGYETGVVVVEKVRHGVFFNIGGTMPPSSLEVLSDEDLGALLAYLGI